MLIIETDDAPINISKQFTTTPTITILPDSTTNVNSKKVFRTAEHYLDSIENDFITKGYDILYKDICDCSNRDSSDDKYERCK